MVVLGFLYVYEPSTLSNPSTTFISTLPTTVYNSPLTTEDIILKINLGVGIPVFLTTII